LGNADTPAWRKCGEHRAVRGVLEEDRKSTRLNSSHQIISYAVFCLKKKTAEMIRTVVRMFTSCGPYFSTSFVKSGSTCVPCACALANPFFFFNDTATTEIYSLSLHDALPI